MEHGSLFHSGFLRRNALVSKSTINFLLFSTVTWSYHRFCNCNKINCCYFLRNWCACYLCYFATMLSHIVGSCSARSSIVSTQWVFNLQDRSRPPNLSRFWTIASYIVDKYLFCKTSTKTVLLAFSLPYGNYRSIIFNYGIRRSYQ